MDLLALTKGEKGVLDLIRLYTPATPLLLSKLSKIPRPTLYTIFDALESRGLIQFHKIGRRKVWELADPQKIANSIELLKNSLLSFHKLDYQKLVLGTDTDIAIHRGKKSIMTLLNRLIQKHGGKRLMGIQGDFSGEAWDELISISEMNEANKKLRDANLITNVITSKHWFKHQVELYGKSWAENFAGRATQTHIIDSKYLDYTSQILIFDDQLYLISMKEKIFIEIKNKDIAKLIISLQRFVEDHSPSLDVNKLLKEMLK